MANAKKCDICEAFYTHQNGYRLTWADAYDYDICSARCLIAKGQDAQQRLADEVENRKMAARL